MPVQKFRTLEEAEEALWREPFDRDNLRIASSVTTLAMRLARVRLPKGLFKYRSLDDADRGRQRWESEAIRERKR